MPTDNRSGVLHAVALPTMMVGAVASIVLMLRAGHPPVFLRVLFAIWVLSPFAALFMASMVSKRWSVITRTTLDIVMLVLTLISLAIYGYFVANPPRSTPAFVWVVVPVASWLLMTIVVPVAALVSGTLSRRGADGREQ
jgi:uncharacterized membrane protein YoaK (UPF0700 family)